MSEVPPGYYEALCEKQLDEICRLRADLTTYATQYSALMDENEELRKRTMVLRHGPVLDSMKAVAG